MSEDEMKKIANVTLEYLRYIRQAVDDLKADGSSMKLRQTGVEQAVLGVRKDLVNLEEAIVRQTLRFDRIDERLDRIERRLGLIEAPAE